MPEGVVTLELAEEFLVEGAIILCSQGSLIPAQGTARDCPENRRASMNN